MNYSIVRRETPSFSPVGVAVVFTFCTLLTGCASNPIYHAAYTGDLTQVRAILQTDIKQVHSTDSQKCTPLHYAAMAGQSEMVQLLLENGAKVNALNGNSATPLYEVCRNAPTNEEAIVKMLIKYEADVNLGNRGKWTPLHAVCRFDYNNRLTEMKVDRIREQYESAKSAEYQDSQAKQNIQNNLFMSPADKQLQMAINQFSTSVANAIVPVAVGNSKDLARQLSMMTATFEHLKVHNTNLVRILLEAGANPNTVNANKDTPLMIAIAYGDPEMVQLLRDHGAK
jgi:ankyrin repeat protein